MYFEESIQIPGGRSRVSVHVPWGSVAYLPWMVGPWAPWGT